MPIRTNFWKKYANFISSEATTTATDLIKEQQNQTSTVCVLVLLLEIIYNLNKLYRKPSSSTSSTSSPFRNNRFLETNAPPNTWLRERADVGYSNEGHVRKMESFVLLFNFCSSTAAQSPGFSQQVNVALWRERLAATAYLWPNKMRVTKGTNNELCGCRILVRWNAGIGW